MIAHIRKFDGSVQPLSTHCQNVGQLCSTNAKIVGLEALAKLIGLMHDMGKATSSFEHYLRAAFSDSNVPSPHHHAPTGAIFAYRRWFLRKNAALHERATAQIIMLCILGHHTGLADCLDSFGRSPLLESLKTEESRVHADEAIPLFLQNIANESELDALFERACCEIAALFPHLAKPSSNVESALGLICRLLLSILVDADRWDSACFEYGENPFESTSPSPDWSALLHTFERFRQSHLSGAGKINRIRADISDSCLAKAESAAGIVTLSVSTGGGKTFSALRYALKHAALYGQTRIFYIIPYNTILDQNARDIREALNGYPSILEHHSNIVPETEDEQHAYQRLTERWDSNIILTSLVQFLNACYAASNSAARRFYRLTNAVLIFDEIQSLPKTCKVLFERAIQFLSEYGHCTVILCTATQPRLSLTPAPDELVPHVDALYEQLKRVHYIPQLDQSRTYVSAGADIAQMLKTKSVLIILNTKAAAWNIYRETTQILRAQGHTLVSSDLTLSENELAKAAQACPEEQLLCIHMSTSLCPTHRKALIAEMKAWLKAGKRVLCISTALIEAGINVSFPTVIRDLAGLPSIVQAAGRANRNMEYGDGEVFIWDFRDESNALSCLEDIQKGAGITRSFLLDESILAADLDTPATIQHYFEREEDYIQEKKNFPVKIQNPGEKKKTLYLANLLGANAAFTQAARLYKSTQLLMLHQSFRTAHKHFFVIPDRTTPVLVPWGKGADIIADLKKPHNMREEILLLRKAQAYSINLYDDAFDKLRSMGVIESVGENGVFALADGFYKQDSGIQL